MYGMYLSILKWTYPFSNLNGAAVEVWEWITSLFQPTLYIGCDNLPMLGLYLTHWGRVTHICVGKLTTIGSDNGLSPGWRQAIIWSNAGILLIEPLGTNFSEILIGIQIFSLKQMRLKMASEKWRPFCLDLNVLINVSKLLPDLL